MEIILIDTVIHALYMYGSIYINTYTIVHNIYRYTTIYIDVYMNTNISCNTYIRYLEME